MPAIDERLLTELESLKKLMILDLIGKGYSQNQIGLALGVSQATISRMFPKGALPTRAGQKRIDKVD